MYKHILIFLLLMMSVVFTTSCKKSLTAAENSENANVTLTAYKVGGGADMTKYKEIILAGGCFWGVQKYFDLINGVVKTDVGYANSKISTPTYEEVTVGNADAAEAVRITYDPAKVSLAFILDMYSKVIDPTSLNKQGNDRGRQYRTGIYYSDKKDVKVIDSFIKKLEKEYDSKKITIEVMAVANYYPAEKYHQKYLNKNPNGYCHIGKSEFDEAKKAADKSIVAEETAPVATPKATKIDYKKPPKGEIKKNLSDMQYKVTQEAGTEPPFKNEYWDNFDDGIYVDIVTGEPLFSSKDKFKSSSGWPSFTKPIDLAATQEYRDNTLGMMRIELKSSSGDTHLGHLFSDGPADKGGQRYCINSASLRFVAKKDMEKEGYGSLLKLFD